MRSGQDDIDHGSVPLITLNRRQNYQRLSDDNFDVDPSSLGAHYQPPPPTMARGPMIGLRGGRSRKSGILTASSYVFDWIVLLVIAGVAYIMGEHEPNRRPFSLEDPNIS